MEKTDEHEHGHKVCPEDVPCNEEEELDLVFSESNRAGSGTTWAECMDEKQANIDEAVAGGKSRSSAIYEE